MFDIGLFKRNAKVPLKFTYWTAFGVCFLTTIISGAFSSSGPNTGVTYNATTGGFGFLGFFNPFTLLFLLMSLLTVLSFSLIGIAFTIFVENPIKVGSANFFLKNRVAPASFPELFYSFKSNYINIVKVAGMQYLITFLWSLLLVIPGIVMSYAYFCVPYILTENPNLEWRQALEISKEMTNGYKGNLFMLDLSFFGWYFLGVLLMGIGVPFVVPYHEATRAEAFEALKQNYMNRVNY